MRTIDADILKDKLDWVIDNPYIESSLGEQIIRTIDNVPTVERPHGEWIEVPKYKGYYVCSECLKRLDGDFERFEHWEMRKDNFCRVCGSDNRKRKVETE